MLRHADDFIWLPFPKIKVPLSLLLDIRSLLYALVNVFHPDLDIRSNFRLRITDNSQIQANTRGYPWVKIKQYQSMRHLGVTFRVGVHSKNTHKMNVKTNCEYKMNDFGAHGYVILQMWSLIETYSHLSKCISGITSVTDKLTRNKPR